MCFLDLLTLFARLHFTQISCGKLRSLDSGYYRLSWISCWTGLYYRLSWISCFFISYYIMVCTLIFNYLCLISSDGMQINGSLLPASVISLYCMYLCYSGLSSEPRDYECNGLHNHSQAVSTGSLALGLTTTVLSVVYSAVRAGSSTTLLSPPSSPRASWF